MRISKEVLFFYANLQYDLVSGVVYPILKRGSLPRLETGQYTPLKNRVICPARPHKLIKKVLAIP